MGAWDSKPWDNDGAADWFGDTFDATGLRTKVRAALEMDIDDGHEEIRAAAAVLLFLGRIYIWPMDHIEDDLTLAIKRLEELRNYDLYRGLDEYVAEISNEIEVLKGRLDHEYQLPESDTFKKWWCSLAGR